MVGDNPVRGWMDVWRRTEVVREERGMPIVGENIQNKPLRKLRQNLAVGKLSLLFRCYSCVTKHGKKNIVTLAPQHATKKSIMLVSK